MAKKPTTSKPAAEKAASKEETPKKRSLNPALSRPVSISKELQAIVGADSLPRTEVTKKVWEYIKANNLQDPNAKRTINADASLKVIFGGKESVDMFEMTKLISNHLNK